MVPEGFPLIIGAAVLGPTGFVAQSWAFGVAPLSRQIGRECCSDVAAADPAYSRRLQAFRDRRLTSECYVPLTHDRFGYTGFPVGERLSFLRGFEPFILADEVPPAVANRLYIPCTSGDGWLLSARYYNTHIAPPTSVEADEVGRAVTRPDWTDPDAACALMAHFLASQFFGRHANDRAWWAELDAARRS